ncbi:MAG: DegT/DnrJ/EryC1/StrS family aminotransferase [Paludibacter sp.]|nr:DegT/DnrJ/EryC1/StrS family aminotransferase [Paludibacter sp.]
MIRLSRPYIPEKSLEDVIKCIRTGNLIQGEQVAAFEDALSEFLDIGEVIVVSSGTAALFLSLIAHDIGAGDDVIIPAYSFPGVANVVELTGARPVFVDISLKDCCIDVSLIERKITKRTAAIMPVHAFGHPAGMNHINTLAEKNGLIVIEDAACALGTQYQGKPVGVFGDAACFSFHPRKILTTGEGGAVVTQKSSVANKIRKLRNHGIKILDASTDFVFPGYNFRMTDFQAAMGLEQLVQLNETITIFRNQAEHYARLLEDSPVEYCYPHNKDHLSTYQSFQIFLPGDITASKMKSGLYNRDIESNIGAHAIPYQSFYKEKYSPEPKEYPAALRAWRNGLTLPMGRHITGENQEYIVKQLLTLVKEYGF